MKKLHIIQFILLVILASAIGYTNWKIIEIEKVNQNQGQLLLVGIETFNVLPEATRQMIIKNINEKYGEK